MIDYFVIRKIGYPNWFSKIRNLYRIYVKPRPVKQYVLKHNFI